MWTDTELQHDVENEVGWELRSGPSQISVTVKGGAVELAGHVDRYWEKCSAERAAWRVVHVSHGVVSLRGTVRSRWEYEEAMHAAWASAGVIEVEDHVVIGSVVVRSAGS